MKTFRAYLGGLLMGTSLSYLAPRMFVHNWWVFGIGCLVFITAVYDPEVAQDERRMVG